MVEAYLSLGSNLGDRAANLRSALRGLRDIASVEIVSSLYETDPVGGPEQPPFHNAACRIRTALEPRDLLLALQRLERESGRVPGGPRWGPRPLDLDILLYADWRVEEEGLVIPHPRMAERAFVLVPLAEIAPQVRHPLLGKTAEELLSGVGCEGVRRVAPAGWERA